MIEPAPSAPAPAWTDPREELTYAVLLPTGRLAGRAFAGRDEAEAWARPDQGERVVCFNEVCDCDM